MLPMVAQELTPIKRMDSLTKAPRTLKRCRWSLQELTPIKRMDSLTRKPHAPSNAADGR
jgi:hypothetical protein